MHNALFHNKIIDPVGSRTLFKKKKHRATFAPGPSGGASQVPAPDMSLSPTTGPTVVNTSSPTSSTGPLPATYSPTVEQASAAAAVPPPQAAAMPVSYGAPPPSEVYASEETDSDQGGPSQAEIDMMAMRQYSDATEEPSQAPYRPGMRVMTADEMASDVQSRDNPFAQAETDNPFEAGTATEDELMKRESPGASTEQNGPLGTFILRGASPLTTVVRQRKAWWGNKLRPPRQVVPWGVNRVFDPIRRIWRPVPQARHVPTGRMIRIPGKMRPVRSRFGRAPRPFESSRLSGEGDGYVPFTPRDGSENLGSISGKTSTEVVGGAALIYLSQMLSPQWRALANLAGWMIVAFGVSDFFSESEISKPVLDVASGAATGNAPMQSGGASPTPEQAAANVNTPERAYGESVHDLAVHPLDSAKTLMTPFTDFYHYIFPLGLDPRTGFPAK